MSRIERRNEKSEGDCRHGRSPRPRHDGVREKQRHIKDEDLLVCQHRVLGTKNSRSTGIAIRVYT